MMACEQHVQKNFDHLCSHSSYRHCVQVSGSRRNIGDAGVYLSQTDSDDTGLDEC